MSPSLLALLPLLLTLVLAFIVRRTLVALSVGIVSGALLLSQFDPIISLQYLVDLAVGQFYKTATWQLWHINVLLAMLLLGCMTQLLARGGAVGQFGDWLYLRINTPRQARLGVVFLGWLVFIDGIFSCLAVGHVCQSLSARYGIRNEQLAYLVDANASPLCSLLPFSSWGPYVMALLAAISFLPVSPLAAFIDVAMLNFYAIVTLGLALLAAWYGKGFAPMSPFDADAAPVTVSSSTVKEPVHHHAQSKNTAGNPWLLGVPMLTLLFASVGLTLWSGAQQVAQWDISLWLAKADIGAAMRDACVVATLVTLLMLYRAGRTVTALMLNIGQGMRLMGFAIAILLCTWMIGAVIQDLGVASILAAWAKSYLSPQLLVAGMFLLCAIMAFATGSSWGTFAIMIPIGAEIAHNLAPELLLVTLSAVMAGSVFGDHCSPISDTSVLSATSSGCTPHVHVVTQLPFALIAAVTALVGFQLVNGGLAMPWVWLCVFACGVGLFVMMAYCYSPQTSPQVQVH